MSNDPDGDDSVPPEMSARFLEAAQRGHRKRVERLGPFEQFIAPNIRIEFKGTPFTDAALAVAEELSQRPIRELSTNGEDTTYITQDFADALSGLSEVVGDDPATLKTVIAKILNITVAGLRDAGNPSLPKM